MYYYCNAKTTRNRPCILKVDKEGDRCRYHRSPGPGPGFGVENAFERLTSFISKCETLEKTMGYSLAVYVLIDKLFISMLSIKAIDDGTYDTIDGITTLMAGRTESKEHMAIYALMVNKILRDQEEIIDLLSNADYDQLVRFENSLEQCENYLFERINRTESQIVNEIESDDEDIDTGFSAS